MNGVQGGAAGMGDGSSGVAPHRRIRVEVLPHHSLMEWSVHSRDLLRRVRQRDQHSTHSVPSPVRYGFNECDDDKIYSSFGGPTEPGVYQLDGINYRDCGLCLLMLVNCTESGNCEKTLYAEEGAVRSLSLIRVILQRYENVVYREVTVSEGDSTSTVVPGG